MAHYLVRARLKKGRAEELKGHLDKGTFKTIKPFGRGLSEALERAHRDPKTDEALWEEQCFCTPPLAAERAAVLDRYFDVISTEEVSPGSGWDRLKTLPALWKPPR